MPRMCLGNSRQCSALLLSLGGCRMAGVPSELPGVFDRLVGGDAGVSLTSKAEFSREEPWRWLSLLLQTSVLDSWRW